MRRLIFAVLVVTAMVAVAACGSSSSSGAASPTLNALSYFPPTTPFVLTLATDPKSPSIKEAQSLIHRFPVVTVAETALFGRLSQLGVDYNKSVRPLFGNPIAVGALGSTVAGSQTPFLVAWETKSASDLTALVSKLSGLQSAGSHDGAKLYVSAGAAVAINGATLLFARSTQVVEQALDRHAHGGGFSSAQYAKATSGIGQNGFIQAFGNLTGVLSTPKTAKARRVPWVAAIRSYGASISAASNGLTIQYHVDTSGSSLSTSQLPIASGSTAPSVAGQLPIEAGVRDPSQIIEFAEAAAQATSPASYARFLEHQATLKRKSGFDLKALVAMLTGDLNVESDTHTTIGRAQVSNPSAAAAMLAKLAKAPNGALSKNYSQLRSLGGGLYAVKQSKLTLTIGVVGDELTVGKATPGQVRAFASAPAAAATAATGSVTFRVALADLLHVALKRAPSPTAQQFLGLLGDITGSASATTAGLTGSATLGFK